MRAAMALRTWLIVVAIGAALVAVPASTDPAAQACSCGLTTVEQLVRDAESVFEMTVTSIVWEDDFNAVVYGEVVDIYKGETPQFVSSRLRFGTSCGGPALPGLGQVVVGYAASESVVIDNVCGPRLDGDALASVFDPIEQPAATDGVPLLVTSLSRPGARIAVLDDDLQVAHYGPGSGHSQQLAACPGGLSIIELVTDDFGQGMMTVETRDLASLAVTAVVDIERVTSLSGPIVDLECHDNEGSKFSYLVKRAPAEKVRQRKPERAAAVIEIWTHGELRQIHAIDAIATSVDLASGFAHVLAPEAGERIERWNVESESREAEFELEHMRGVDLARDKSTGAVSVLASQLERVKKHGHGYLVKVRANSIKVRKIKNAARPRQLVVADGVYYTLVKTSKAGMVLQTRGPAGALTEERRLGFLSPPLPLVPAGSAVAYKPQRDELRLIAEEGEKVSARLEGSGALTAIDGAAPVIRAADIPPIFERGGSIVSGGVMPPDVPTDRTAWYVIGGIAAIALAFGVAALRRVRREDSDDTWMVATRYEGPEGPS